MKLMRLFAVVLTVLLLTVACQTAKPPVAPAAPTVTEVQARADAYMAAVGAGDAAGVAALYTDDGIMMANEQPAVAGKDAINALQTKVFGAVSIKGSVKVEEVGGSGEWAFARGTVASTSTLKAGGKSVESTGKWMNVLKRQPDGSWKIYRHIWNLDHPNPAPAR